MSGYAMFEASKVNAATQAQHAFEASMAFQGDVKTAMRESTHSALIAHERGVLRALVGYLCETAEAIDAEEDPDEESLVFDGVACLLYAAMDLEEGIPMEDRVIRM